MTHIDFFFNVPHKFHHVAKLGEEAVAKGQRVLILTADPAAANKLQSVLWSHSPTGFLPNCRSHDRLAAETPLVIDCDGADLPHDDVLINLQQVQPPFFSRFRCLIELVGMDEDDRACARERFRFYRDRGYAIRTFDVAGDSP